MYALSWIGWTIMCLRELMQFKKGWKTYFGSHENQLECLLLMLSGLYLGIFYNRDIEIDPLKYHLASWSLFCGWIEVTLLVGRLPLVGLLIHMSLKVVRELLICIVVFLRI